jgi:cytochrome c oxidase subunit 1
VVTGLRTDSPEALVTTVMQAEPVARQTMPGATIAPLAMAAVISAMLVAGIFTPWAYPIGIVGMIVPFAMWTWPRVGSREHEEARKATVALEAPV